MWLGAYLQQGDPQGVSLAQPHAGRQRTRSAEGAAGSAHLSHAGLAVTIATVAARSVGHALTIGSSQHAARASSWDSLPPCVGACRHGGRDTAHIRARW
jgi:hypothetical protein